MATSLPSPELPSSLAGQGKKRSTTHSELFGTRRSSKIHITSTSCISSQSLIIILVTGATMRLDTCSVLVLCHTLVCSSTVLHTASGRPAPLTSNGLPRSSSGSDTSATPPTLSVRLEFKFQESESGLEFYETSHLRPPTLDPDTLIVISTMF
ncbi:hypothetical protein FB446DRAFT_237768 [Lentinula raphanica]|nr:hypothetical protein FB446DRAFT_237768 [Lentinula raphanica]